MVQIPRANLAIVYLCPRFRTDLDEEAMPEREALNQVGIHKSSLQACGCSSSSSRFTSFTLQSQQSFVTMHWLFLAGFAPCLLAASSGDDTGSWQSLPGSIYTPPEDWATCKDASWPVSDVGNTLVPQSPDDEVKELLAEIDPERVKYIIEKLVSFGTRHTLSSQNDSTRGIGAARDWIYQEIQSFGGDG